MCGCLLCASYWGPGLQPRHVPQLGIEQATLWFTGWCSIHCTTPARAGNILQCPSRQLIYNLWVNLPFLRNYWGNNFVYQRLRTTTNSGAKYEVCYCEDPESFQLDDLKQRACGNLSEFLPLIYTRRTTDLLVRKTKFVSNLRKLALISIWCFIINVF